MNKKSIFILIYIFILGFVMNIIYPVFPVLFSKRNIDEIWFGFLGAGYSLTCAIFGIVFANLSYKYGNRLFLSNLILFGLSLIFFFYNIAPIWILLSRIMSGIFISGALVISNIILINNNSNNKKLIFCISLSTGIFGLGNATGFFIGGLIGNLNYLLPFYVSCIISIVTGILAIIVIKDNGDNKINKPKMILNKEIILGLLLFFLVITSFSMIGAMIPFLMNKLYKSSSFDIGLLMFSYGVIGLLINFLLNPYLKKKISIIHILYFSFIIGIVSLVVYLFFSSYIIFYIIFILLYLASISLARPPLSNIIINKIDNNINAMALSNFSMYLATLFGNLIAGFTYKVNYNFVLIISSFFLVIAIILMTLKRKIYLAKN